VNLFEDVDKVQVDAPRGKTRKAWHGGRVQLYHSGDGLDGGGSVDGKTGPRRDLALPCECLRTWRLAALWLPRHRPKPLQWYLIAGSFTAVMNSALMTLTTGPTKECGCQAVSPPLTPCRLPQYNAYTPTRQLSFCRQNPAAHHWAFVLIQMDQ